MRVLRKLLRATGVIWALRAQSLKKSRKMSSRGGPQKVEKGVEKESESTVFQLFWLFFDSIFDFLGPGAERPQELIFGLFFQLWARRAQMTPVAGPGNPNACNDFEKPWAPETH